MTQQASFSDVVSVAHSQQHLTSPTFRTSWWGRRTFLERGLFILLILSFLVIVAIVIFSIALDRSKRSKSNVEVCLTPDCVRTASRLLDSMDATVDPCDDFFEYACGTWNRKNVIPDDRSTYNTFGKLRDDLQVILKDLLDRPISSEDPAAIVNTKYLYQSCLNLSQIEERGDTPLHNFIQELGGWPVLNRGWNESQFDYIDTMAQLRLLNNWVLVNMWVSADDKNSNNNIIQIDQPQLGMPSRDYYLKGRNEKALVAYQTFAIEIAKLLGASEEAAKREMAQMVDFEIILANMTVPAEDRRNTEQIYHRYKVSELSTNISDYIEWPRYINRVFSNVSLSISEDEDVVVYAPQYLHELGLLLQQTPQRTLSNYMMWRIVLNRINNMPKKYLDLRRAYQKALFGTETDRARWRTCVNYVNDNFGMAVGRMFVEENFDEESKQTAISMIGNIRSSFTDLLQEVPWMDEHTREVAREKADSIQEKIGFPDYIMNNTALDMDYEGIHMDPSKYFENVVNNLNAHTRYRIKVLRDPVDKTTWSTYPAIVNAFYSATKNQITFPAGILQPPFYHESYPKSLSYGAIGMAIGHEITHGFDDEGRQFDKDGNLIQWWSNSVIEKFKEEAQCIIDQYGNYTIPEVGLNLNGIMTQGENIADNGGIKQSFKAYRTWIKAEHDDQEEPPLPGLNLSHNQLFFLNFAQIWCGSARPESYLQYVRSGRHSPGRFRVIGSVSNSEYFAEAFNCTPGSKMNPVKKCSVW